MTGRTGAEQRIGYDIAIVISDLTLVIGDLDGGDAQRVPTTFANARCSLA